MILSYPGLFKNIPHVWFLRLYSFVKNPQHDFPKMRGGGSKAVWNFSENSSVLDVQGIPYDGITFSMKLVKVHVLMYFGKDFLTSRQVFCIPHPNKELSLFRQQSFFKEKHSTGNSDNYFPCAATSTLPADDPHLSDGSSGTTTSSPASRLSWHA